MCLAKQLSARFTSNALDVGGLQRGQMAGRTNAGSVYRASDVWNSLLL